MDICPTVSKFYQYITGPEPFLSSDVFEQGLRTTFMVSLGIFKNSLCHVFPLVGAILFNYRKVEPQNLSTQAYINLRSANDLIKEVDALRKEAGLKENFTINVYTGSIVQSLHSYGGTCSLTAPLITIPESFINRLPSFDENSPWHFSQDEVRFLIAREVGYIQGDHSFVRTMVKLSLFASLFFIMNPYGLICIPFAIALYLYHERSFQKEMDIVGVDLLQKTFNKTEEQALQIAQTTLQKLQTRNIEQRKANSKMKLFVSKKGNNWLDINLPSLTSRLNQIDRLKAKNGDLPEEAMSRPLIALGAVTAVALSALVLL